MASILHESLTRILSKSVELIRFSREHTRRLSTISPLTISLDKVATQCLTINALLSQVDSGRIDFLGVLGTIARDIESVVDEALILTRKFEDGPNLVEKDQEEDLATQQALDGTARLLSQLKGALAGYFQTRPAEEPGPQINDKPTGFSSNSDTFTENSSSMSTKLGSLSTSHQTTEDHDCSSIDLKEYPWLRNWESLPKSPLDMVIRDSMLSFNDDDVDTLRLSRGISFFSEVDYSRALFSEEAKRSNLSALQRARNIFKKSDSRRLSQPIIREPVIGLPENPMHVHHVGFDEQTGEYIGLPREWKEILRGNPGSESLGNTFLPASIPNQDLDQARQDTITLQL